jgi:hypothetical protein
VVHFTRDFGDEWRVCEDHRSFVFALKWKNFKYVKVLTYLVHTT